MTNCGSLRCLRPYGYLVRLRVSGDAAARPAGAARPLHRSSSGTARVTRQLKYFTARAFTRSLKLAGMYPLTL